jgi:hypothetical protein
VSIVILQPFSRRFFRGHYRFRQKHTKRTLVFLFVLLSQCFFGFFSGVNTAFLASLPFTLTGRAEGALKNLCIRTGTEWEKILVYRAFCAAPLGASVRAPIPRRGAFLPFFSLILFSSFLLFRRFLALQPQRFLDAIRGKMPSISGKNAVLSGKNAVYIGEKCRFLFGELDILPRNRLKSQ